MYQGKKVYQDHISDDNQAAWRAGAITAMDTGVGRVVSALKEAGLYDNSVIIFTTDNGGPGTQGSNYPLRGSKEMLYEGGVRGVSFVHSPALTYVGYEHEGYVSLQYKS